jgi:thiol-disulfide isomerase/thioredoxin
LKALSFSATGRTGTDDATKLFGGHAMARRIRVDRDAGPAHNGWIVKCRFAPEVRGTLRSKAVAALCCAGAVFCFALLPPRAGAAELQRLAAGGHPQFSLPDMGGTAVALESARGHGVLVHFFATWCEPCREELPALSRLVARAGGDVRVLAIAVAEPDQRVRRFFATIPVDFPVLLDRDRAVAKAWNVASLPTTFVLDENLRPKLVVESDYAWDTIDPGKLTASFGTDAGEATAIQHASNR